MSDSPAEGATPAIQSVNTTAHPETMQCTEKTEIERNDNVEHINHWISEVNACWDKFRL
ncbi:MAG: hypothetical protein GWO08_21315 [Gammaproteobacteria bacterium]|nr:hypothetical protein [Gammaproteobacteria bacterium]NIN62809.1 hypothetical protein [Gammaproteobacteria bacterium]NIO63790.1 hypothetical protein [Gammaproteobacteria bacterium]NIP50168.1 hypothetical protein [Gammaproteobacteria bacterium]NIQ12386.1 hypothetical protein [Gammaproteobacteria bacterium]